MKDYQPDYTGKFYDAYGHYEWDLLEATAHGRLQEIIHIDFMRRYVRSGDWVLDAGSGPGRFTVAAAKLGSNVTALDLSEGQLELAKEKVREAGLLEAVHALKPGDIADLSIFSDGQFDAVVCYGGPLSYVCDQRHRAACDTITESPKGTLQLWSGLIWTVSFGVGCILGTQIKEGGGNAVCKKRRRGNFPYPSL